MNDINNKNSALFILYYMATNNTNEDDSLIFQYLDKSKEEGIPIGKLFFWVKGVWVFGESDANSQAKSLYERLMGVNSIEQFGKDVIASFQNIESFAGSHTCCAKT